MAISKLFLTGDQEPLWVALAPDLVIARVSDDTDFVALPILDLDGNERTAYVRPGSVSVILPTTQRERESVDEAED